MLILKKDRNLKNVIAMLTLFIAALAIDATAPATPENVQEARFLGIGTKKEVMPCTMGIQDTVNTFTIFWIIKVGESWTSSTSC